MIQKTNFHPISREVQILIVLFLSITLALASACTSARQMASQKSSDGETYTSSEVSTASTENYTEDTQDEESEEVVEKTIEEKEDEEPARKQRLLPPPFKSTTANKTQEDDFSTDHRDESPMQTHKASADQETPHANARVAKNESNEKIEQVLDQLVEQNETIINLMHEQMDAQKEFMSAHAEAHTSKPANTPVASSHATRPIEKRREEFRESDIYEESSYDEPSYAQKTVLEEEELEPYEVKVSISPELTIVLDEELLIQWEETVAAMERGAIPRTKLPAWILQGLEWITHAPSHEPERSQILMPLYRHMQYAGHLDQVNMNSMSPADVVGILRVFVDEMKEKKGRIRKA